MICRDSLVRTVKLCVKVLQGRNLVAKDTNIFGTKTTSNPYVKVYLGSMRTPLGQTRTVFKALDPDFGTPPVTKTSITSNWGSGNASNTNSFERVILVRSLSDYKYVLCHIFDHDVISKDDSMGTVTIPLPDMHDLRLVNWYKVEFGDGDMYCENASGELLVKMEIKTKY